MHQPIQRPRPTVLQVAADPAPTPTAAHLTDSDDVLVWWLPLLGPTATLCAHRLARHATRGATRWDLSDLARSLGLGDATGRLHLALDRLTRFGLLTWVAPDAALIRLELPRLTPRQLAHLPAYLADAYPARTAEPAQ